MTTKTYRVTSDAKRDMSLVNLPEDAVQDYWFDIDASDENKNIGEFEVEAQHVRFFEHVLNNDEAVVEWERK